MELNEKLNNLPSAPGVYIMKDNENNVIYVGKAKVLKNRVKQYFNHGEKQEKVAAMVAKIADFEYIITKSELDAFLLENNLIKKYKPYYNILLKDSKTYPYIKLIAEDDFPRLEVTRIIKKDGAKYFGPYFNGISANELIKAINLAYPIRTCTQKILYNASNQTPRQASPATPLSNRGIDEAVGDCNGSKKRLCLNYALGLCKAPCMGYISKEEYGGIIEKIINFLNGKDDALQAILKRKMAQASALENFELALTIRNQLFMLDKLKGRAVTSLTKTSDIDVFAYASNDFNSAITVLIVRGGKMLGAKNYNLVASGNWPVVGEFLQQYYLENPVLPKAIILERAPEDLDFLQEYFEFITDNHPVSLRLPPLHRGELTLPASKNGLGGMPQKVKFIVPRRGINKKLLEQAQVNVREFLETSIEAGLKQHNKTMGAMLELKKALHLQNLPARIEAYDISNISGTNSVASMVVFLNGQRAAGHYRRFKIKTVEGPNDFASLMEVMGRRLERLNSADISFGSVPKLILIDGGKGQVSACRDLIKQYNQNIDVIGLAKQEEEVFVEESTTSVRLSKDSYALKLLQAVRDEAHRFAITFHRSLRNKKQTESVLDGIEGVGKAKKKNLLEKFKTVNAIKNADIADIASVRGINLELAGRIKQALGAEN